MQPIEDAGAWLFRVARNRVVDLFRRKRPAALADEMLAAGEGVDSSFEDLLPSTQAGPEAALARSVLLEELTNAFEALPDEQRAVFYAHEVEGLSFKEIAARTGLPVSTLLSRKHHAGKQLRRHLRAIYDDYK